MSLDAAMASVVNPEDLDTEKAKLAIRDRARDFLIAGGAVSWLEWCAFNETSRDAFYEAGLQVTRIQSALLAEALRDGPEWAMAPLDEGEAVVRDALRGALERVAHGG